MASNPTPQEVYNYLRSKGLNNNQAQGILANIDGESGLDMNAEGDRNSGGSIGLFQYNYSAGRAQSFVAAVPDWRTNWRGQVDYVIDKDPQTRPYLNKTFNSPESAAADFMRKWEVPDERLWESRDRKHNNFIKNNNFNSNYQSGSSSSSSSPTADQQAVAPKDKIKVSNPKELSQEALRSANAINDQVDVVNKLIKDNEGTAYDQWSDELKAEYNNELNRLAQLDEKLKELASDNDAANCLARETIGKSWSLPEAPDCTTFRKTKAYGDAVTLLREEVSLPDPCGTSDLAKINTTLLKFFNTLKQIRKFGETYINGVSNSVYRITNLIRSTASIIGSIMKGLMQNLRNWLIDKIRKGIQLLIDELFPTLAKQFKNTIIGQIIDNILCKFKDIVDNLRQLVADFLFELVGKVVNAPLCAVQQFTNGLINNVVAMVDKALGPVLDSINDLLGGIGKIAGSIFEAIDFILGFEAYLCQKPNCPEIKATKLGPWANAPSKPF